ncbi:uncharacterized protein PHACADRAFT_266267 [Phanerochaete carnosa HHB-10118-sp]|uniref:Uncharacterized protein n=1 Tax=Phanerochaete carnosa (strain HHB-10118-sp) TaxID=650164 RepID=K5VPT8_PHACS|nr:uncharacterized protein PHACADRAFT_266267 [Phanerochaete carnosa HHB-10118-sp]EKM48599.1 hypothetical protein PHACADRAFT_266267 [Phanerochaete carnosa HHB-10118-sp]
MCSPQLAEPSSSSHSSPARQVVKRRRSDPVSESWLYRMTWLDGPTLPPPSPL